MHQLLTIRVRGSVGDSMIGGRKTARWRACPSQASHSTSQFYSDRCWLPSPHFFTLVKALGHKHHFWDQSAPCWSLMPLLDFWKLRTHLEEFTFPWEKSCLGIKLIVFSRENSQENMNFHFLKLRGPTWLRNSIKSWHVHWVLMICQALYLLSCLKTEMPVVAWPAEENVKAVWWKVVHRPEVN